LPANLRLSSDGLFAHFGIEVPPEKRHTALGDAVATAALYLKLVEVAR
jgi:DNA polymerase-3 subunit epsilon